MNLEISKALYSNTDFAMDASDQKNIQMTRKPFPQWSQLLQLSTFAVVALLMPRAVMAQTEAGAAELLIPTSEAPVVQPAPAVSAPSPATPSPLVVEPVTPSTVVPSSIETAEPAAADYGTVFIEPQEPQTSAPPTIESLLEGTRSGATATDETPAVELVSPDDYGTAIVDTTDYSVGATMPDVVISERSSGCEYSVDSNRMANAACRQVERLAGAIATGMTPGQFQGGVTVPISNIPGIQLPGATTAASRDYYNQAAKPVVQLQLGEKFIFPLTMPASLSSLFGWRMHPIFGVRRFHTGTDVAAPLGTPVVATQSGRVTLSEFLGGYGLMVILRHNDDTLESRYAHLSRLLVQTGEWVEQGEVIGLVGSTGNSTGPHLHFELRQLTANGWAVLNPDSLLKQTLGTLVDALGSSLVAMGSSEIKTLESREALADLPFRPAQPHAN